jgi:Flp pilus assembly protein TadG
MLRQEKGQTTVEFALVAILFLTLLMTIIDFAIMFYVNQTIQHAVRDGARYSVAKRSETGLSLRDSMEAKIKQQSMGLFDKNAYVPNTISIYTLPPLDTIQSAATYTGATTTGTGDAQALISVEYTYSWPLMTPMLQSYFPNGRYTFTVKTYVINEPN